MARIDRSLELIEELAGHFAPPRLRELKMLAGVEPDSAPLFRWSDADDAGAGVDTIDALGAVSAAIETINRQLEILVGVAASHARSSDG